MMQRLLVALMLALGLAVTPALAVESGTAVGVNPDATANKRVLNVGDGVSVGETVATGPTGQVQMLFGDATKLVVGPGSSLKIDDYLLRQDNSVGKFTLNALAGTYRFVTGNSDKQAYEIKTPTGTIGVRGTAFDFTVAPDGTTTVILFHGAVQFCNRAGQCVDLTGQCQLGAFNATQAALLGDGNKKRKDVTAYLPYVFVQATLLSDFRVVQARKCLVNPAPTPKVDPLGPAKPGGRPSQPGTDGGSDGGSTDGGNTNGGNTGGGSNTDGGSNTGGGNNGCPGTRVCG